MTYEKDTIPDFALVPARQPAERVRIPVTQGAIFSPLQITAVAEKPRTLIHLEEDILVPDTRPDLKEILDLKGSIRFTSRELNFSAKTEEAIPISGDVELQVLYIPEKSEIYGPVIAITNRISFRELWHTEITPESLLSMDAQIASMEALVINERKFRVKITLRIHAREYREQRLELFEGLAGEEIQTLRESVELTGTVMRKKDLISISEELELPEGMPSITTLLQQDLQVVENYRQAAAEKMIVNGFIYVNLLCLTADSSDDIPADSLRQMQTRVEFTQFIPLTPSGSWSGSFLTFDGSDLRVRLVSGEDGAQILRLEGDILTLAELYRNTERELITDAYHREKDFLCDFEETTCRCLTFSSSGEAGVRELISLENTLGSGEEILFVSAHILSADSHAEPGKIITEGKLSGCLLCRSASDGNSAPLLAVRREIPFRCVTAAPQLTGTEQIRHQVYLKDLWAEKNGSRQAEFNATVLVSAEAMAPVTLKILKNPSFGEVTGSRPDYCSMVIYMVKEGDTLWSVARRFQSTADSVAQMNQIDGGKLQSGQKLLILR